MSEPIIVRLTIPARLYKPSFVPKDPDWHPYEETRLELEFSLEDPGHAVLHSGLFDGDVVVCIRDMLALLKQFQPWLVPRGG